MSIESDRTRLFQERTLEELRRERKLTDMVTIYQSYRNDYSSGSIFCALIPSAHLEMVLSTVTWDMRIGEGMPGAYEYSDGEKQKVEYFRYGNDNGIEPLAIKREFLGMQAAYWEISEEFRLFHNLYHDSKKNEYIKFDDAGNETRVAVVEQDHIRIRLKEIRQFLAIKEMHLSVQFAYVEYSSCTLEELGMQQGRDKQNTELLTWTLFYGDARLSEGRRTLSLLDGKRLFAPLPKSKSGFWGFAEEEAEGKVEFIIDVDENGDDVTYSSDPDSLANYFGANPDAPDYLTAVHFRKQVLDKYFQQPSKYSVEDSLLRCGTLWHLRIDNHHDDKVCVWLGDLGCYLPYQERLHWKSYNIPPEGHVSETFFRRQILAEPLDSDRPEHLFVQRYQELEGICQDLLGWQMLQPLDPKDMHHLQALRVPFSEEQRDFDGLVLSLATILVDSLNMTELRLLLSEEQKERLKKRSIAYLEAVLASRDLKDSVEHIDFLRKLQHLRSITSAHRKGRKYKKLGFESQSLRDVFADILRQAIHFLDYLIFLAKSGRLQDINQKNGGLCGR